MKKWSLSLIVAAGLLAIAALAIPAASGAVTGPYCPGPNPGEQYKPCEVIVPPPPPPPPVEEAKKCATGQVGTYPNCVTPALDINKIKVTSTKATVTATVNAPGTLVASGKGLATSKPLTVTAGSYNLKLALSKGKVKTLKKTGKVKIAVSVLYSPTGATAISKEVTLVFKAKVTKHHHHHHHH